MLEKPVLNDQEKRETPESVLERKFIAEYLLDKGYRITDLRRLPREMSRKLMIEACRYATLKLAEIEARSRFREIIKSHIRP